MEQVTDTCGEQGEDMTADVDEAANSSFKCFTLCCKTITISIIALFVIIFGIHTWNSNNTAPITNSESQTQTPDLQCPKFQCTKFNPQNGKCMIYLPSHADTLLIYATDFTERGMVYPPMTKYEWEVDWGATGSLDSSILNISGPFDKDQIQSYDIDLKISYQSPYHLYKENCAFELVVYKTPLFGIDLGTTFSCIAYQFPEKNLQTNKRDIKYITADLSKTRQKCIPTAIYFPSNKQHTVLVGYEAREKLNSDPQNVIFDIKRIIGRKWKDPEVKQFAKTHPFEITTTYPDEDNIRIKIKNRNMRISPEQALAVILKHLAQTAMRVLNIPTEVRIGAVVSIPAFFHNGQRRAIQSAAKLANIEVKELVVEPTAGAMAHKYYSSVAEDDLKLFQVFDYGGGTLDCSVMRCTGLECEVLGVAGNSTLGGIDYDRVIREIIIDKLKIDKTKINEGELLEDSEMIKKWLSKNDQYSYKYKDKSSIIITRTEFEKHPKTQKLVESAMKLAKLAMNGSPKVFKFSNIRMILMIGGSSNLPIIRKTIEKTFSTSNRHSITVQYLEEGDSQLMVTAGSAVLAGYMAYDRKITVSNVIPLPLGFSVC
eukprot:548573_1